MSENIPEINNNNMAKVLRLREWGQFEKVKNESVRDPLTGLHNRRYFDMEMEKIDKSEEHGTLVIIDVDRFKKTNDDFGHPVGDKVLISIARILQGKVHTVGDGGGTDVVARIGGEEFGIWFKDFSDRNLVYDRVDKIREAVADSFVEHEGNFIKTTISLGVAIREKGEPYMELMKDADDALYIAKNSGRNKYVVSKDNA